LYPYIQEDDTMTNQELLISHISKLSEDEISSLLDAVTIMLRDKELTPKPACPHCAAQSVIRYGFKCKKQRFLCKNCGHTFVPTTNTMYPNLMKLLFLTAIKARNWTPGQGVIPANMAQKL